VTAIPFEEIRLDNGLRVIAHEDPASPVVTVHVMVHVGSKNELPGRTGFAHLFEHLLFQGSEHVPPGAHFTHVQEAGGTLNGSTAFDRTNYFESLPVDALDLALWLESDRLGWFLPGLTEEKFEAQRSVVMNERRQRYENPPYGLWLEKALALAFPEGHPYRHPTIGSMADLAAATFEDVRAFFLEQYAPANVTLVVAGGVDATAAAERVERWFGPIPARPAPGRPVVPPVRLAEERRETVVADVELPRVHLVWHAPPWTAPGSHEMEVAAAVLGGGRASRLWSELVYRRRIAQDVTAVSLQPLEDAGLFLAVLTGKPGTSTDELIGALDEIVTRLAAEGPSLAEMERARARLALAHAAALESVAGRADALAHAAALLDDPGYVERRPERLAAVDAAGVRDAVGERLAGAGRAVVDYVPSGG